MNETTREALNRPEIWKRGLFMVLFAVLYGVAEVVLSVLIFVQFVVVLFSGSANQQLLKLGSSLAHYCYQIYQFLTFNSEDKPFPMADWPEDDAQDSPWYEDDAIEAHSVPEPESDAETEVNTDTEAETDASADNSDTAADSGTGTGTGNGGVY